MDKQEFSSLSESGFIPTITFNKGMKLVLAGFSSLSESGFIPTSRISRFYRKAK